MNHSIDEDAELVGIKSETWKEFKKVYKVEQPEFKEIVNPVDDAEAKKRHLQAIRERWFGYYKKCKSNRNTIIDQYNKIALMKQKD